MSLNHKSLFPLFDIKDIFFGIVHAVNNNVLINYIILEGKYFIYRSKLNKFPFSISLFLKNARERMKWNVLLQEGTKSYFPTTKHGSPAHFSNNSYHFLFVSKL